MMFDSGYDQYYDPTMYRQCTLKKKLSKGVKTTTTFLPTEFSIVEKVIKLKDNNGEWDDGWVVESVSKEEYDSDYITILSGQHRLHRYYSDI